MLPSSTQEYTAVTTDQDVARDTTKAARLFALIAPVALVFLKGCLLGAAIAGVVALADDVLGLEQLG